MAHLASPSLFSVLGPWKLSRSDISVLSYPFPPSMQLADVHITQREITDSTCRTTLVLLCYCILRLVYES